MTMTKLPEGRSTLTDEQMIGLTHRLVDTCIDCKGRIEELEAKLAKAVIGLKDVIGVLDDPTGDEHVRDMRAATMIARTTIAELTSSEAAYNEVKGGKDG